MSIQNFYNKVWLIISSKYPNIMMPRALVITFIIYAYYLHIVNKLKK